MAFKHIQANTITFLLSSDGTPTGLKIGNEDIPNGSLAVDSVNAILYILRETSWVRVGDGDSISGSVITVYETPIVPAGTSGWQFQVGSGTSALEILDNTLFFYVNTQKSVINIDWVYDEDSQTITWISSSYDLEENDLIEIYYDVRLP